MGVADHLGWAVVIAAAADHSVVDRRRIELVEPGVPVMPIHHHDAELDVAGVEALVAEVRASAVRATAAALDSLATDLDAPIETFSLRALPADFPHDIATQLVVPWEARADAVMYREVLVDAASARGWDVRYYSAKDVIAQAVDRLGDQADEVLQGPRALLGPPWTKDHRTALAATVLAS